MAGTFARDLHIATADSKAAALALLERLEFDLVLACETLTDGSGLEVLSHVAANTPDCLRIFAARPSTLRRLKGELGLFGLFRTLQYPIDMRKMSTAVRLARGCLFPEEPPRTANIRHVVLESDWQAGAAGSDPIELDPKAATPTIQHEHDAVGVATTQSYAASPAGSVASHHAASNDSGQSVASDGVRPEVFPPVSQRPAPSNTVRVAAPATPPPRIVPSASFQRALARRNAARLAGQDGIAVPGIGTASAGQPTGERPRRSKSSVAIESLAQLAHLTAIRRIPLRPRDLIRGTRRRALFVGTGLFAAVIATVVAFSLLHSNNSVARQPPAITASIDQPMPTKAFPWQQASSPPVQVPGAQNSSSVNTAPAPVRPVDDDGDDGLPDGLRREGPPPPAPGPLEPPSLDSLPMDGAHPDNN